jgi:hypothetical protein
MKILISLSTEETTEPQLKQAIERWFEMWQPKKQIKIILNSPLITKFRTAKTQFVWRCFVLGSKDLAQQSKTSSEIIVYSYSPKVPHWFFDSLEINKEYLIIKKKFNPKDLILNFNDLAKYFKKSGGWDEKELWMKANTYYTTFKPEEIVFDSRVNKRPKNI